MESMGGCVGSDGEGEGKKKRKVPKNHELELLLAGQRKDTNLSMDGGIYLEYESMRRKLENTAY